MSEIIFINLACILSTDLKKYRIFIIGQGHYV